MLTRGGETRWLKARGGGRRPGCGRRGVGGRRGGVAADVAAGPDDALFGYIERFAAVLVAAGFPPMLQARVFVAAAGHRLRPPVRRRTGGDAAWISPAAVSGAVRVPDPARPGAQGAGAGLAPGLLPDARQHVGRPDPDAGPGHGPVDRAGPRGHRPESARTPRPASGWPSRPPSSSSPPRSCPRSSTAGQQYRASGSCRRSAMIADIYPLMRGAGYPGQSSDRLSGGGSGRRGG